MPISIKTLVSLLLFCGMAFGQRATFYSQNAPAGAAIVIDGAATACTTNNGASAANTVVCAIANVTVGDTIVCYGALNWGGSVTANGFVNISDPSNGLYNVIANNNNATIGAWNPIAYVTNAASGSYNITATVGGSAVTHLSMHCDPFKNTRTTLAVDSGAINMFQFQAAQTNANSGSAASPGQNGEVILCIADLNTTTPTAGSGYTLSGNMADEGGFSEYSIQTTATATNCPWTNGSDAWQDTSTAIIPVGGSAGISPLSGTITTFEGTNTVAPTTTTIAATTKGIHGTSSSEWVCTNTHTDLTYATAGQLSNFLTNKWANGTNSNGSGSTGFQYATGSNGDGCTLTFSGSFTTLSVGFWMRWDLVNADSASNSYSMLDITNGGGSDFANIQLQPTGTQMQMRLECKSGVSSNLIVTTATTYWVTWSATTNGGTDSIRVYDTSGSQLLSSSCAAQAGSHPLNVVIIGNVGAESQTAGKNIWFDDLVIDTNGGFPILP